MARNLFCIKNAWTFWAFGIFANETDIWAPTEMHNYLCCTWILGLSQCDLKSGLFIADFFFIVRQLLKYLIFGIWNFCRVNQLESFFSQFFFVKMVHYSSNGTRYMRHKVKSKWFMFEFGKDAGEIHFKLISHTANHTKTSYLFC